MDTSENIKLKLSEILTREEVNAIAKKTGFFQRTGKICPFDFLMVLIFRLAVSYPPALRLMVSFLEKNVSRSGLHQRFSEKAAEFVKCCLQTIIAKQTMKDQPVSIKLLEPFNRVIIQDSSSWDISPQLKEIYTGAGGSASKANCKLQFCYDYKTGSIILLEDTKGTEPDQAHGKQIKDIVKENDLILRDLGYSSYETFADIAQKKAYFCSRFLTTSDVWELIDGKYVKVDFEKIFKQNDAGVELNVFLKGKGKDQYLPIRLIAFPVPQEIANLRRSRLHKNAAKKGRTCSPKGLFLCDWSMFIINASEDLIPSKMIRTLYRIRWSIELVFKNWKSILKIHVSSVRKNHWRIKCELYAKLILAVMVHSIHQKVHYSTWTIKKKEISFDSLWKYIIARAESLHGAVKKSASEYVAIINSLLPSIIKVCEKYHQPSRKTTLQMIDEMIGDVQHFKIIGKNCLT
ncbi:Transposase DDE domain-containing protein [Desulfonema limicola]|uniref:Transposase DDE domain-containing protein n=1 Tax=Desulfonema limicola TaxID=45656 RepID=A0A975GFX6_9BACT|nr:IS4 family transposase [Desulfonema limicola]QTA79722.1 Transposase DDE domain-containing protein [Desulfonema limicola]